MATSTLSTPCKTVFIAYPHNPKAYVYLEPPEDATPQIMEQFVVDERRHREKQLASIQEHMKLVNNFANFLQQHHVKVYYDQQIYDVGCSNIMKWFEEKIEESDYVILVATQSLVDFLEGEVPVEEEPLFVGDYLYNLITLSMKHFLPVFLDSSKDINLLPVGLRASSMFQICQPFSVDSNYRRIDDDLDKFYAQLTGQNLYQHPLPSSTGPVPLSGRGRLGRGRSSQQFSARGMFERLSNIQECLTERQIALISEKSRFHTRWRLLAPCLGLTPAQIEACDGNSRGQGDAEKCYQVLELWYNKGLHGPSHIISVAYLAGVVYEQLKNMEMLEVLVDVLSNS